MIVFIIFISITFGYLLSLFITHPLVLNMPEDFNSFSIIFSSIIALGLLSMYEMIEEDNDRAEGGPLNR